MPSCAESTRLLSEAQERPLSGGERVALRWHLLMCGACRRFERQLDWLRLASARYVPLEPLPAATDERPATEPRGTP